MLEGVFSKIFRLNYLFSWHSRLSGLDLRSCSVHDNREAHAASWKLQGTRRMPRIVDGSNDCSELTGDRF
jgi:hypothetical protein